MFRRSSDPDKKTAEEIREEEEAEAERLAEEEARAEREMREESERLRAEVADSTIVR
jgi:hypothetical protein